LGLHSCLAAAGTSYVHLALHDRLNRRRIDRRRQSQARQCHCENDPKAECKTDNGSPAPQGTVVIRCLRWLRCDVEQPNPIGVLFYPWMCFANAPIRVPFQGLNSVSRSKSRNVEGRTALVFRSLRRQAMCGERPRVRPGTRGRFNLCALRCSP
jgi:hypothetical protein